MPDKNKIERTREMERLFNTHEVRQQMCLDGIWEFQTLTENKLPDYYTDTMTVPACWEMALPYRNYRGLAAYRTTVSLNHEGSIRLLFKGISHTARVFWDKNEIGTHYNAYTPFEFILENQVKGKHELEIIVDNRFTENSKLHVPNDYFTYGGIIRPVFVEELSEVFIQRVSFTSIYKLKEWSANLQVVLENLSTETREVILEVTLANRKIKKSVKLKEKKREIVRVNITGLEVTSWSLEQPNLYFLTGELYQENVAIDDSIDRVGFRRISIKKSQIYLNERPLFIRGINRHEDHGIDGAALSLAEMENDLRMIQDLGLNAVRTAHYPNDERFLDLCDEKGVLVWEEGHARIASLEAITDPLFIEQSLTVIDEMLENHQNHPSIGIWGCLNEAASDQIKAAPVYQKHLDKLKKDKTRLVTYASDKHSTDLFLNKIDIYSFNCYPMWYGNLTIADYLKIIQNRMHTLKIAEKPIIISEFGGGAIYNFHDVMNVKWSEEYQAQLLTTLLKELENAQVAGYFIWQFSDTRVSQEGDYNWPITRPKSRNNKGIVDEYRRPKMGYYAVKEVLNSLNK